MPRFAIHLCLVSDQATPNLTPVLDESFAPEKVILVVSAEMARQASALADVLKSHNIECQIVRVSDAWDLKTLQNEMLEIVMEHEGDEIALNVTCGTKPMAIAAQEVFRTADKPVFYVRLDTDEIALLDSSKPPVKLDNRIKLRSFLNAHGVKILETDTSADQPRNWRELIDTLVNGILKYATAIGTLNYYAGTAKETLESEPLSRTNQDNKYFMELVSLFAQAGILELSGNNLRFPDKKSRFFANGGWLEDHVFDIVKRKKGVQDQAKNVEVKKGNSKNELDVAFLARNILHIIECKTRNLSKPDAPGGVEALYKLGVLTALGGLKTKGMVVSYRDLRDADVQRAKDLGIKTIVGSQIQNLSLILDNWISRG